MAQTWGKTVATTNRQVQRDHHTEQTGTHTIPHSLTYKYTHTSALSSLSLSLAPLTHAHTHCITPHTYIYNTHPLTLDSLSLSLSHTHTHKPPKQKSPQKTDRTTRTTKKSTTRTNHCLIKHRQKSIPFSMSILSQRPQILARTHSLPVVRRSCEVSKESHAESSYREAQFCRCMVVRFAAIIRSSSAIIIVSWTC